MRPARAKRAETTKFRSQGHRSHAMKTESPDESRPGPNVSGSRRQHNCAFSRKPGQHRSQPTRVGPTAKATRARPNTFNQHGNRAESERVKRRGSSNNLGTASQTRPTATKRAHINMLVEIQRRNDSPGTTRQSMDGQCQDEAPDAQRAEGQAQSAAGRDNRVQKSGPPLPRHDDRVTRRIGARANSQREQETAQLCILAQAKHTSQPVFETAAKRAQQP